MTDYLLYAIMALGVSFDLALCVPIYTKKKYDHSSRKNKLVWKGVCIGIPFLMTFWGTLSGICAGKQIPHWVFAVAMGMFFCALGDIYLEIRFVVGGFLFFAGHFLYVTGSFLCTGKATHVTVVCFVLLAGTGTVLTLTKLGKKHRIYLLGYNLMISASFAMGVTFLFGKYNNLRLLGTGLVMLVASDWLLARNKLKGSNYLRSLVSLLLYFGGQLAIAATVMLYLK